MNGFGVFAVIRIELSQFVKKADLGIHSYLQQLLGVKSPWYITAVGVPKMICSFTVRSVGCMQATHNLMQQLWSYPSTSP